MPPSLQINHSPDFPLWLQQEVMSLVLTTYPTNYLLFLSTKNDGSLAIQPQIFEQPMALSGDRDNFYLANRGYLWHFNHICSPQGKDNHWYIHTQTYATGIEKVHDLKQDSQGNLLWVNSDFNCLATVGDNYNFVPLWQPPFISELVAENRCYLNGLALVEGKPSYMTAYSQSNLNQGWQMNYQGNGIVIDISNNQIINDRLFLPHSPRWYQNRLWVLNSGTKELGYLDTHHQFCGVVSLPGFARGLEFHGKWAVVGLSKKLTLDKELPFSDNQVGELWCGLVIIDINTGKIAHWLKIEGVISEIFDLEILTSVNQPQMMINWQQDSPAKKILIFPGLNQQKTEYDTSTLINIPRLISQSKKLLADNQIDEAIAILESVIKTAAKETEAYQELGKIYQQQGKLNQAEQLYQQAIALEPQKGSIYYLIASVYQQQEKYQLALQNYEKAIALEPDLLAAYYSVAKIYAGFSYWQKARDCLLKAIEIAPECAESYFQLGRFYLQQGETQAAIKAYGKTVELQPDSALAHYHLGVAISKQGRKSELITAGKILEKAIELDNNYASAYASLAGIREQTNNKEEALKLYQKALEIEPQATDIYNRLQHLRIKMCDWQNYQQTVTQLIEQTQTHLDNNHSQILEPWALAAFSTPPDLQKQVARHRSQQVYQTIAPLKKLIPTTTLTSKPPRIKIGYLSPDFRFHAVGTLIYQMFQYHNREEFEVYAYSLVKQEDEYQQAIRNGCDYFRDISTQDTLTAAQQIQADGIHILIDLAGYTTYSRPEIMALNPAPIQIHYLGFPGTMGADFVPYLIADKTLIPTHLAHLYSEKIIYLPQGWVTSPTAIPPHNLTRKDCGLPETGVVFCNFNNSYKLNPMVFTLWMKILQQVKDSVLWLADAGESVQKRLKLFAEQSGVNAQRIIFAPQLPYLEHLARTQMADLCLDTFPYNAGATAVDALLAGVPLLTHPQETYVSRMGASLCHGLGFSELICDSLLAYQTKAIAWGNNPPEIVKLKEKLAIAREESALFKPHLFILELEKALKKLYYSLTGDKLPEEIIKENKHNLALVKLQAGKNYKVKNQLEKAINCFQEVIKIDAQQIEAYHQLGLTYQMLEDDDRALEIYNQGLKINNNYPLILANIAIINHRQNNYKIAIKYYEKALKIRPDFLQMYENLGKLYTDLGDWYNAERILSQALKSTIPSGEIYFTYGNLWLQKVNKHKALECYQQAVNIQPDLVKACYRLGASLLETGKKENWQLAEKYFRQAIAYQADCVLAYYGLGILYKCRGKKEEALKYYHQAFSCDNSANNVFYHLEHLRLQVCDWEDYPQRVAEIITRTENELTNESSTILEPYNLTAFPIPPALQKAVAGNRAQQLAQAMAPFKPQLKAVSLKPSPERIKIGYVSADFRLHPVGILIQDMFQYHTRPDFEVFAYSLFPAPSDRYQAKIKASCEHFLDISNLDCVSIARQIQDDEIDILIDLTGYTRHGMPEIFALQPAPIQIQYLGYPSTMGADFLPYIIADEYLIPPHLQQYYSEKVIYLPHGWVTSAVEIPQSNLTRKDYGLPLEGVVYGNFNSSYKLNPTVFGIWMNILKAVNGSVLWLNDGGKSINQRLINYAQQARVNPERIIFAPRLSYEKHLARTQIADLFLDTFPYNAGATAIDTVRAGVPLLTYSQQTYVSRMAGSVCHSLGLDELICHSPTDYQQKAIAWGENPAQLHNLKQKLAMAIEQSSMFKTEFFIEKLEQQLKQIYNSHISS